MWWASHVKLPPRNSARMGAPLARACSSSSSTSTPAPMPALHAPPAECCCRHAAQQGSLLLLSPLKEIAHQVLVSHCHEALCSTGACC